MSFLLGLDVGTSSVKALLLEYEGLVLGTAIEEYPLYTPLPGWSEQDPEDMWLASVRAIKGVLEKCGVSGKDVSAIGLSGQMHSAIFLDRSCEVIRPAILWNDVRTGPQCRLIKETVSPETLLEEASNPALEGFTLPKVLWLREHEPRNFEKMCWVILPKDYVRFRLTGNIQIEISDAAGTLMMNVRKQEWSRPVLNKLGLDDQFLPPIIQSLEIAGEISTKVAALTGLKAGTPVVGGGADNACGAVGSGVVEKGRALLSLGTSGVLLAHLEEFRLVDAGTIHMFNSCVPNEFYMMGVMLSAGFSLNWFRNQFGRSTLSYSQLTEQAAAVPAGSRGLTFLPYLMGERTPHGDSNARGCFIGISPAHDEAHLARAVLEGVALAFRDSLELLWLANWRGNSVRGIGGGMRSSLWKEIIASVTGLLVEEINVDEGPALGAAILAGSGIEVYESIQSASNRIIKVTGAVEPNPEWQKVYDEAYGVFRGLYPSLKDAFEQLARLV